MTIGLIDITVKIRHHVSEVRTTINIDDDVFEQVREYAESRSVPLGKAVSQLVQKGLSLPVPMRVVDGFALFELPPGSPRVSASQIKELESEVE